MSEKFMLNLGGQRVELSKSENLVAVRPKPGLEAAMERTVEAMPDATLNNPREMLGGFRIVEIAKSGDGAKDSLDALRLDPSVATATHVFHTSDDGVPFVPTGSIYIEFKDATDDRARQEILDESKLQILEAREGGKVVIAKTTAASPNPVKVAAKIQASGKVDVSEPDLATPGSLKSFRMPVDALLGDQWHLRNVGRHRGTSLGFKKGADARVRAAWDAAETLGSPEVVVAVIDDGFDLAHPDLATPGKIVHPWDFTRNNNAPTPDGRTQDWHGTACAGVAVGSSGGGDILGAAPGVTLMPVRWGSSLDPAQVEAWFNYVRLKGAWVVSCSWGAQAKIFPVVTRVQRAIERCAKEGRGGKGVVVVFAAGNSNHDINDREHGSLDGFAILPDVMAVSASTSLDERADYSNFGKEIWICAPSSGAGGWGILTSDVTGSMTLGGMTTPLGYSPTDYTYNFGGTSSACPLVAGICALVLSVNRDLTAAEVRDILAETARRIGNDDEYGTAGRSLHFGYGCVDAEAAVRSARQRKASPVATAQASEAA